MFVFQMFDYYSGSRIIILIAAFECITIAWIYGKKSAIRGAHAKARLQ